MICNLLSSAFRGAATTIDPVHPKDPQLAKLFGIGTNTFSGVAVDEYRVLALPAVTRAIRIISNEIAKLEFKVNEEHDEGATPDMGHVSWTAVYRKPHPEITAGNFRRTMTSWALSYGNAVACIHRPNWPNGPIELLPLLPDRTFAFRERGGEINFDVESAGTLMYGTRVNGQVRKFLAEDCLHIQGLGPNPYWGFRIVEILKETFGGALATQEFGHRFFGQGANPAGFIEMPGGMKPEAEENFRKSIKQVSSGLGNAHKFAVLEENSKFHKLTIDPEQAQFLGTKELDVRWLAMAIGIKAHKLIDSANSSYSSLEQANQEHKDDDLMPWICTWQEELEDKLLTEEQKESGSHSIKADDQQLQWVSFKDRAEGAVKLYNNGLNTKQEARKIVNHGPSQSPNSDRFRIPRNIGFEDEADGVVEAPTQTPPPPPTNNSQATHALCRAALARFATFYGKQARSKAAKGPKEFMAWLDGFDVSRHVDETLEPEMIGACDAMSAQLDECTTIAKDTETLIALVGSTVESFTRIVDTYADQAAERLSK